VVLISYSKVEVAGITVNRDGLANGIHTGCPRSMLVEKQPGPAK
jgi:hypothetical protein